MRKIIIAVMAMVTMIWFTSPTHATLWDRGGGLIYDDVLNITWLQDANYSETSGYFGYFGAGPWGNATTWATNLVYDGLSGWRLPTTVDGPYMFGYDSTTTGGFNIMSSEMGYMYYMDLGNKGYYATNGASPQPGWSSTPNATFTDGNGNTVSFQNLRPNDYYWSGTTYSLIPGPLEDAWIFCFYDGYQGYIGKDVAGLRAWAVRPGDVSAVPEPSTLLLLGPGLAGLWVWGRKKFKCI